MKSFILTAFMLYVSFRSSNAQAIPQNQNQLLLNIVKTCASLEEVELTDLPRFAAATDDKVSDAYKCFVKCEFEAVGLLSMGKLDDSRLPYMEESKSEIILKCDRSVHIKGFNRDDDCDYGFKLGRCIANSFKQHLIEQEKQRNAIKTNCAKQAGFSLNELDSLKAKGYQNATQSFKCFQNCLYQQAQILQNERLNRAIFHEEHNDNNLYNQVKECHVDIYEQGYQVNRATSCEFAYQLFLCLQKSQVGEDENTRNDNVEILEQSVSS